MTTHLKELSDLRQLFETSKLPDTPLKLNKYMVVNNIQTFIESQVTEIMKYKQEVDQVFDPEKREKKMIVFDSLFKHLRELKGVVKSNS